MRIVHIPPHNYPLVDIISPSSHESAPLIYSLWFTHPVFSQAAAVFDVLGQDVTLVTSSWGR